MTSQTAQLDRKGILSYLIITFVITYAIEAALIFVGFRAAAIPPIAGQLVIAGVMWVPALATVLTILFVTREGFGITNLRIGPLWPYLTSTLVVVGAYAAIYGLTWLLGLGSPDWQLRWFGTTIIEAGADPSELPNPPMFLLMIFGFSLLAGGTINALFGFGEELGWRGYLLPKLMPLGKPKAYTLLGVIWGLWHAPLIAVGYNYPGYPVLGILAMVGLMTALGIYINEMTLRYQSSVLAGWIHGMFNGQAAGIWRLLFPGVNPLLGGLTGIIAMLVWLAVGMWQVRRGQARPANEAVQPASGAAS